jgi:hypothetical protein
MWNDIKETYRQSLRTDRKGLRDFGFLITAVLVVLGLLGLFKGSARWVPFMVSGGAVLLISLTAPVLFKPFYHVWMGLAAVLSYVMTRVILGLLFYTLFSVIGIGARILRRDLLDERLGDEPSYWRPRHSRPVDRRFFQKQF